MLAGEQNKTLEREDITSQEANVDKEKEVEIVRETTNKTMEKLVTTSSGTPTQSDSIANKDTDKSVSITLFSVQSCK